MNAPAKPARKRLDQLLVERGLAATRQKAQALILAGAARLDGQRVDKAGTLVSVEARLEIAGEGLKYASRGGLKLEGALEDFGLDPSGLVALDVGSSTGGFTDCLLQRGARRVWAVDVSPEQLDWKLRRDDRVVAVGRNARSLTAKDVTEPVDLVTADVAFISVTKVLPALVPLARPGADFLILVKPQFELERGLVGKGGIVRDAALRERAVERVREAAQDLGLEILGVRPSRITGAEGNQEFFLHARKAG
ncbi:MAG TPA: TlyA family RNA methyltransferase [Patescibacteria group bacterium]|nr:TlyA family RNA methyltransferase [Patescibacteria group bacterium]